MVHYLTQVYDTFKYRNPDTEVQTFEFVTLSTGYKLSTRR